jgi:hypothetical protein
MMHIGEVGHAYNLGTWDGGLRIPGQLGCIVISCSKKPSRKKNQAMNHYLNIVDSLLKYCN